MLALLGVGVMVPEDVNRPTRTALPASLPDVPEPERFAEHGPVRIPPSIVRLIRRAAREELGHMLDRPEAWLVRSGGETRSHMEELYVRSEGRLYLVRISSVREAGGRDPVVLIEEGW